MSVSLLAEYDNAVTTLVVLEPPSGKVAQTPLHRGAVASPVLMCSADHVLAPRDTCFQCVLIHAYPSKDLQW